MAVEYSINEIKKAIQGRRSEPEIANISEKYRMLFRGPLGVEVLSDILWTCGWGESIGDDPYDRATYNVALCILNKCGLFEGGSMEFLKKALNYNPPAKPDAVIIKFPVVRKLIKMLRLGESAPARY